MTLDEKHPPFTHEEEKTISPISPEDRGKFAGLIEKLVHSIPPKESFVKLVAHYAAEQEKTPEEKKAFFEGFVQGVRGQSQR